MKKNQPITIDDLATMVARGFDEQRIYIDTRFDLIGKQFSELRQYIDQRFDRIETRLDDIEHQLVQIERKQDIQQSIIERHVDRIRTLEKKVGV